MSNDLISRSALLEEINNFSMRITGSVNAMAITITEETKKSIAKMVDLQPAAYDVDNVIKRIEMSSTDEDGIVCYVDKKPVITKEMAIKIVKSGGIKQE
jgi:hypothetical protein